MILQLQAEGIVAEAERAFQSAVSVTAEMARKFHSCLTEADVRCYIAPFEADAQMARMVLDGIAAAAVTEDSDLIPYGVESCIYKLDRYGNCTVVTKESLANKSKTSLDISHMTQRQRVQLCILAGCDYLPSIEGIGIRKALEFMRKYRDGYSVIRAIRAKGKHTVPVDYEESFRKAEVTFACHRVYDIALAKVVPLSGVPEGIDVTDEELMAILGPRIEDGLAQAFCEQALIDPRTMHKWPPILRKPKPPPTKVRKTHNLVRPDAQCPLPAPSRTKITMFKLNPRPFSQTPQSLAGSFQVCARRWQEIDELCRQAAWCWIVDDEGGHQGADGGKRDQGREQQWSRGQVEKEGWGVGAERGEEECCRGRDQGNVCCTGWCREEGRRRRRRRWWGKEDQDN